MQQCCKNTCLLHKLIPKCVNILKCKYKVKIIIDKWPIELRISFFLLRKTTAEQKKKKRLSHYLGNHSCCSPLGKATLLDKKRYHCCRKLFFSLLYTSLFSSLFLSLLKCWWYNIKQITMKEITMMKFLWYFF